MVAAAEAAAEDERLRAAGAGKEDGASSKEGGKEGGDGGKAGEPRVIHEAAATCRVAAAKPVLCEDVLFRSGNFLDIFPTLPRSDVLPVCCCWAC